jgi:dTDP-4-amino-4,6-dideoxygalactose transaminase
VTEDLTIDLDDLARKAAGGGARALLLSHMRGHICDMDRLMAICNAAGLPVIEDCAHTMGAAWRDTPSGRHGVMGCYSTQTYKHMNSGEGGLLVSDDPDLMARAIILSGSYMLYDRHRVAPPPEAFEKIKYTTPNISGRMDNLRAAILRPQLSDLPAQCARWNELYQVMERGLAETPGLQLIARPEAEAYVASSFQFLLPDWPKPKIRAFLARSAERGVELKWFGGAEPVGFTSRHDSWRYADAQELPQTDRILGGLIDMRLPLTFSIQDAVLIARIIRSQVSAVMQSDVEATDIVLSAD